MTRTLPARPRVLLVSHGYSNPGRNRQIQALADYVDVRLVAPDRDRAATLLEYRPDGDTSGRTVTYRRVSLGRSEYVMLTATMGMLRHRPHLVHVNYPPWAAVFWQARLIAALFAPRAAVTCGVKKNTYRRYPGLLGTAKYWLGRLGVMSIDHVVAASGMTAAMYRRIFSVPRRDVSVASVLGVDTVVFAPRVDCTPDDGPARIGYCGRLSTHKGVLDLVNAVERCQAKGAAVRLELLGAGELEGQLRAMVRTRPWLIVHEAVSGDEVANFLRRLDVYVLPARNLPDHQEHDAHALLQALACGVPCIGTRSGIIPEILTKGVGIVTEPGDPGAIGDAIIELVADRERCTTLGERSRALAEERYSLPAVARSHANIYRRVVASRRAAQARES